jgi:drug/metabolite transporter (DMT)-like permease
VLGSNKRLAYGCYAFIALVWGTTYLAIKVAVAAYPAFLMAGARQVAAALCMIPLLFVGTKKPLNLSGTVLGRNAIIGFLMITIGNGVVSWAEQVVPSGVAALVCSMMPISVVLLGLFSRSRTAVNALTIGGMALGFAGVAVIFRADVAALSNPKYLTGIGGLLLATFGWGGGSLLMKRWSNPANPTLDVLLQVFFGGLFLLLLSPTFESYSGIQWWNPQALLCWAYLVIFGSMLAMLAYRYALKHLPVSFVTSYAYINPLVAVLLGTFFGEPLNIWTGLAFACIIGGVALVNRGKG